MSIAVVEYFLILVTPILLTWEWVISITRKSYPIPLFVVSVSCLWLLLALIWHSAIGPDYSNVHAYIVGANLVVVLLAAITVGVFRSQRRLRTLLAALSLSVVWFVALSVMYAV